MSSFFYLLPRLSWFDPIYAQWKNSCDFQHIEDILNDKILLCVSGHIQDVNGPQSGDTENYWQFSLTSEQKRKYNCT